MVFAAAVSHRRRLRLRPDARALLLTDAGATDRDGTKHNE